MCTSVIPGREIPVWYYKVNGKEMYNRVSSFTSLCCRSLTRGHHGGLVSADPAPPHIGGQRRGSEGANSFTLSAI